MKTATKRQFDKRLEQIGYKRDDDDVRHDFYGFWNYSLFAPAGLMFAETGCHAMCGSADTKPEMYGEILERIGVEGLVPCDNEPCDGCDEEGAA
jgi:hypothetical protein